MSKNFIEIEKFLEIYNDHENYPRNEDVAKYFQKSVSWVRSRASVIRKTGKSDIKERVMQGRPTLSQMAMLAERDKKYDEYASAEECIKDLRRVQKAFEFKFITRNFYRVEGKFSDATWNRYFGNFEEFRAQAGLQLSRHQRKLEREIAKHASHDHYRKYFEKEVLPWVDKYERPSVPGTIKTLMICSDLHDKEVDEFCLEVFIDSCRREQPDIIILNGDIFDLYEFSRFNIDPRRADVVGAFKFAKDRIFAPLRLACPDAQIDFIMGNHEFRLLRMLADNSPYLRILLSDVLDIGFAEIFGIEEYEINWTSKLDLAAYTKTDLKEELRQNYKIYFDCYAVSHEPDKHLMIKAGTNGHHHKAFLTSTSNIDNGDITWVQTPGMHRRDAEYVGRHNPWNCGFLKVVINTELRQVIQYPIQVHEIWAMVDGYFYSKK